MFSSFNTFNGHSSYLSNKAQNITYTLLNTNTNTGTHNVSTNGMYTIITFTSGISDISFAGKGTIYYVVVGGGGAGYGGFSGAEGKGGGGGSGGRVISGNTNVLGKYTVTVGNGTGGGGLGGTYSGGNSTIINNNLIIANASGGLPGSGGGGGGIGGNAVVIGSLSKGGTGNFITDTVDEATALLGGIGTTYVSPAGITYHLGGGGSGGTYSVVDSSNSVTTILSSEYGFKYGGGNYAVKEVGNFGTNNTGGGGGGGSGGTSSTTDRAKNGGGGGSGVVIFTFLTYVAP